MNARLTLVAIFLLLLTPSFLFAEGSAPWFQHLFQEDFDVTVTIAVHSPGEPGVGDSFSLERVGEQHTKWVFEEKVLTIEMAISSSSASCHWSDPEVSHRYCRNHPEECVDCDNDDENECYGWCEETYYYQFSDECVPPGVTTYNLYGVDDLVTPAASHFLGVDDNGQECLEEPDDDDDDTGDDDDTPAPDDDDDTDTSDDDDDELQDDSADDGDGDSPGCG